MTKRKPSAKAERARHRPAKQYPGVRGKVVERAEHVFEQGMLYVRVRFTDQTELCWVLEAAHVIVEADLTDWTTGDAKQLAVYARNQSEWK